MSILVSAAVVLRCLSEGVAEITVSDLVRRSGMPKSNASRLLRAMRDAGFLEIVEGSKRFRPSQIMVDVGRVYRRSSSLVMRADAVVRAVSARCGHTGYVSKRDGVNITAVTDHPGTNALRVVSSVGRVLPAFASATGRSLLARLDDGEVAALYDGRLPPAPSASAPQGFDGLIERLHDIRRTGIATSHDEANRGVAAVAVAVGDPESGEDVALCIVLPAATSDPAERDEIARALHQGAAEIAALFGDPKFINLPAADRQAA